jgi:hypothetical protein
MNLQNIKLVCHRFPSTCGQTKTPPKRGLSCVLCEGLGPLKLPAAIIYRGWSAVYNKRDRSFVKYHVIEGNTG